MSTLPGPESWRDAGLDQVDPGGDVDVPADPLDAPARRAGRSTSPTDPCPAAPSRRTRPTSPSRPQSVPPDERDEYP